MSKLRLISIVITAIASVSVLHMAVLGQGERNIDRNPDQVLRSNARINPSTLAMEMAIPLGSYPGRAGNDLTNTLQYSSKVWNLREYGAIVNPSGSEGISVVPHYSRRSAAGWTSSLSPVRIDYPDEFPYYLEQGAGDYEGAIWSNIYYGENSFAIYYMKRIRVTMPGGSSHEFRASDTPIFCGTTTGALCNDVDLTGTYYSVDGTKMRLVVTSLGATLFTADGRRMFFGAANGSVLGQVATSIIDAHGNRTEYDPATGEWTDTMGRVIESPLPENLGGSPGGYANHNQEQTVGDQTVSVPGIGSNTITTTLSWRYLKHPTSTDPDDSALGNTSQSLAYPADFYCVGSYFYTFTGTKLFNNTNAANVRLCNIATSSPGTPFNPIVLSKITLANGQTYQFKYNLYGEIEKIIYPTGGYERFVYGIVPMLQVGDGPYDQTNRGVTDRYVSVKGDGTDEVHWTYEADRDWVNFQPLPYTVTITNPDGTKTEQLLHDEPDYWTQRPFGFDKAWTGRPYEERSFSSDSTPALLSRRLIGYEVTGPLSSGYAAASRDLRPVKEIMITFEPGENTALATMIETVYDTTGNSDPAYFSSLNPKQIKQYTYKAVATSAASSANMATASAWFSGSDIVSTTENDYLYDADYKARNISGLVTESRVKDSAGNVKARTQITYDEAGFELASTGSLPTAAADTWIDPETELGASIGPKRGFATTLKEYKDISAGQYITTNTFHDQYGNTRKIRDGRGNDTETIYDSSYAFGYLTSVVSAVPDDSGTKGSDTAHVNSFTYDMDTGLMLTSSDPNSQVTTFQYEDPLLRRTTVVSPNGHQTITEYGSGLTSSDQWTKVTSQTTSTESRVGFTYFDGMGRIVRTRSVREGAPDILSDTTYDNLGRVKEVSNPYFEGEAAPASEVFYDSLGRMIKTVYPDESETLTDYGLATVGSAIGLTVTSTDQSGRKRRAILDARSLILRVDEPDASGSLGPIDQPYQPSDYSYDVLSNLTQVVQAGNSTAQCAGASPCSQTRSFSYDALSRLLSGSHPEDGTTTFTYDGNGNVLARVDARGVTTSSVYDRLNRLLTKSFTGESGLTTPTVHHYYDNVTNAKGKLVRIASSVADTRYTEFDSMGMAEASEQRVTPDQLAGSASPYIFEYSYDLAGNIEEVTYPSSRRVTYDRDLNGYLSEVSSSKNSTAESRIYASKFAYNSAGKYTRVRLGNGLWERRGYNDRLQVANISLGTAPASTNRLKIENAYGVWNGSGVETDKNNGGIARQTIIVPGSGSTSGFTAVQIYEYDSQNRLLDAAETISGQTWRQRFKYDRYGNRTFDESVTTTLPKQCLDGSQPVVCQETRERLNPSVSVATNRLTADQDGDTSEEYQHDANGNVTKDVANGSFSFDADNRQVEFRNPSNQVIAKYQYDGYGNRISKEYPGTGETTYFVYDAFGNLAAEYSTNTPSNNTHFSTVDALDSPRIVTDQFGRVASRDDFHPFGESVSVPGLQNSDMGPHRLEESSLNMNARLSPLSTSLRLAIIQQREDAFEVSTRS